MVTLYKTVYREEFVDDMANEVREVNRAEFHACRQEAEERLASWNRNGQGVGVYICQLPEEFIRECESVRERLQHTGEFGFTARRRIRREARERLLPVRTKENKRMWFDMSDYLYTL